MYHMTTTILARMDKDTNANAIIEHARHFATQMDAKVILFRSIYNPSMQKDVYELDDVGRYLESKAIQSARNELLMVADKLRESDIDVEVSVNWRSPDHTAFSQISNRIKPVLIVCGRSPSSLIDTTEDADTDWELFELTDIPVLYVDRSPGQTPTNIVWAAVDPMPERIESNTLNNLIIERAKHLAVATESELHLVHFHSSAMNMATGSNDRIEHKGASVSQLEVDDQHATALLDLADCHNINGNNAHTFPGVSEAILPILADRKRPDIVVTGADQTGLVTQFPSGTTARKLLKQIAGALCIVRLPRNSIDHDAKSNAMTQARG